MPQRKGKKGGKAPGKKAPPKGGNAPAAKAAPKASPKAPMVLGPPQRNPKDQALFKTLPVLLFLTAQNLYEQKKFKKGLKAAEQLLSRYPQDGGTFITFQLSETLALKALFLNGLKRNDGVFDLVKLGLRYAMKSHVPWHILGILHRQEGEYDQAIKCYLNAFQNDPSNSQVPAMPHLLDNARSGQLANSNEEFAGL